MDHDWDCIVVGAGAAGLSAALVLGRARVRTLVVDAGEPSNRFAHAVGGLLGHDGRPPAELYAIGRERLAGYDAVELRAGSVVGGARTDDGFALDLADGSHARAGRVVLATGMDYRPPQLAGVAERWGRSVFHCPFCHGWEVRDRALGVLDRGASGVHRALLMRQWSDDVVVLTDGPADLDAEGAAQLAAAGVTVDERPVAGLLGDAPEIAGIAFADGSERACGGLLVPVTLHQRSDLPWQLGAARAEPTPLSEEALALEPMQRTSVPGLFAAGDVSGQMPSVANAIASGSNAAASVVQSLTAPRPSAAPA